MYSANVWSRSKLNVLFLFATPLIPLKVFGAKAETAPMFTAGDSVVLEEIIVTAQKRAESVQDVPSSISVLAGGQLENLQAIQLTDYAAYVPGFQVDSAGVPGAAQLTLRGVSAGAFAGPTVGTYIDDSPVGGSSLHGESSSFALDLMPYDIERVEVLRGPQGTLYGASTMGGLLKYVLRAPNLNDFEARLGAEGDMVANAHNGGWGVRGGINLPIVSNQLGLRASYFHQTTPGFIDNGRTGSKDENGLRQDGGRVALLWQASEGFSVKLQAMLQNTRADGPALVTLFDGTLQPINGDLTYRHVAAQPYEQKLQFYSATANWHFNWADFISASSYSRTDTRSQADITDELGPVVQGATGGFVSPATIQMPLVSDRALDKFTQEFRLVSPGGKTLEWLIGAFYTKENYHLRQTLHTRFLDGSSVDLTPFGGPNLDPFGSFDDPSSYGEAALFGDATYKFTPQFDLTGGVRFAHNHSKFREGFNSVIGSRDNTVYNSANVFTYMVSPRWHVNEDTMMYARIASGYRPGGANVRLTEEIPLNVDADTLINYEVGIKSDLLEHKLLLDASVFYIDWKKIEVNASTSDQLGYITNGSRAGNKGIELTAEYRPVAGLRLGFNGSYLDAKVTETADPSLNVPFVNGARLGLSPKWSGSLTANYEFPLTGSLKGLLGAGYRYVGDRLTAVESDLADSRRLNAYEILDLNFGVTADNWTLQLYCKNVTDERAYLSAGDPPVRTDPVLESPILNLSVVQPRTVGVSLDVRF